MADTASGNTDPVLIPTVCLQLTSHIGMQVRKVLVADNAIRDPDLGLLPTILVCLPPAHQQRNVVQVRKAFMADTASGNTLIVADYSQLELRLLAHVAGCKSMLEAFKLGGDFHSRTALGMYDHIKEAVDKGTP